MVLAVGITLCRSAEMHKSRLVIPPASQYRHPPIQLMPSGLLTRSQFMDPGAHFLKNNIARVVNGHQEYRRVFFPVKHIASRRTTGTVEELASADSDEAGISVGRAERFAEIFLPL